MVHILKSTSYIEVKQAALFCLGSVADKNGTIIEILLYLNEWKYIPKSQELSHYKVIRLMSQLM